jgi:hypothetical protein
MNNSFNSNYYITAAAITPVLYLALTLQGSTLEELLKLWKANLIPDNVKWNIKAEIRMSGSVLIAMIAAGGMFLGILAEFLAVLALYRQKASSSTANFILGAITYLLILVAAGPFIKFWITYFKTMRGPEDGNAKGTDKPASSGPQKDLKLRSYLL